MPAEPERTVVSVIPDKKDREKHISRVTFPGLPDEDQIEIADYIPSRDLYGRGYLFDKALLAKVIAGLRKAT